MRNDINQLVICYPNGSFQVVKPMPSFNGNWQSLAEGIANQYYPRGVKVKYELR
jgi:hypothetical protein